MNAEKKQKTTRSARPRIFGAGTLIALLAAGAYMTWTSHYGNINKPAAFKRNTADFGGKFVPPAGPRIDEMLSAQDKLSLTDDQRNKLRALDGEWREKSKPAIDLMKLRASEMRDYLNASAEKKVTIQDMRDRAAPLSEATARYRTISGEFQARATEILTDGQRKRWAATGERKAF